jgi:hypothetical protein
MFLQSYVPFQTQRRNQKNPKNHGLRLAYVVLPATPLVTKAEHAKDQTNLTLRAYYGWNPMPQIVQATALKVRESFETIREISYNRLDKFSSVTSAIQTLAAPLNKGIEGILGGVKSENPPKELLGPLQNFYEKIEKELYDLITNSLDSFFDKLKDIIIEFSSETLEKMIESITGYFVNATKDWIGKEWNWILDKLLDHFKLRVFDLSKIISKMILSLIGNFIEIDLEEEINNMNKKIEGEIDKLKKITSDFIEKIKEKWDQIVTDFVEKRLDTIHKVLFDVKLRITKMSDSGGLNIGTTLLDVTNNFMSSLSKGGGTAVEAVRKLNGVEREILGVFIKARDATTYLSSLIRIPILGREGKLQATIIGLGSSTVSDEDGYLGTIVIPHSQLRSVAGWYNEYPLVLHPAGLPAPIPADYSLVSPEIEELRDSLGAAPPSVLWVKVNEVGPVLKGGRIEIAILGDPTRPSAPHGTKILVYRHDGSVEKKNLGDLPFIGSSNPSSVGGGFAPYIPFPIGQQSLKGLDALEPGSLMVSYYVSVFEEEHVEDPSARAVPRILVPADTATGTVLVIPYLPFPQPAS